MSTRPNLADPDYEPTDEELAELMRSAFAGVQAQHEQRLTEMRERIAVGQAESRRRLAILVANRK